jgi:hypothetical protein
MATAQDLIALQPPGYEVQEDISFASGFGLHFMAQIPVQHGSFSLEWNDPVYVLAEVSSRSARFTVGISATQHLGIWLRDNAGRQCHVWVTPERFVGQVLFFSFEALVKNGTSGELRLAINGTIAAQCSFSGFDLPNEQGAKVTIGLNGERQRPIQMTFANWITAGKPWSHFARTLEAARHVGIYTLQPPTSLNKGDTGKAAEDLRASYGVIKESIHAFHERRALPMYRAVAVELRKLIFDPNPLLTRLWPYARLHRLNSPMTNPIFSPEMRNQVLLGMPVFMESHDDGKVRTRLAVVLDEFPIPVSEWANQPFINSQITLRGFVKAVADKEGAHADPKYGGTLDFMRQIQFGDEQSHQELIIALGEYVLRALEIYMQDVEALPQKSETATGVTRDVEVDIEFIRTEDGGRIEPARTGYRPQLYYDGHDWDAVHEYPDVDAVQPGQRVLAYLCLLSPVEHLGKLVPGKHVEFREGAKVIATGTVTRTLDLPQTAYRAKLEGALDTYYRELYALVEGLSLAERFPYQASLEATFALRNSVRLGDTSQVPHYVSAERHRRTTMPNATTLSFDLVADAVAGKM